MSIRGWRWPYSTAGVDSRRLGGVRHWVLIEREARRGVWKLFGRVAAGGCEGAG